MERAIVTTARYQSDRISLVGKRASFGSPEAHELAGISNNLQSLVVNCDEAAASIILHDLNWMQLVELSIRSTKCPELIEDQLFRTMPKLLKLHLDFQDISEVNSGILVRSLSRCRLLRVVCGIPRIEFDRRIEIESYLKRFNGYVSLRT